MKSVYTSSFIFLSVIFLFSFIPFETRAQNANIQMSPTIPAPNTEVSLSLQSFSVNLDRSTITWTVDGKEFISGVGVKDISINVGPAGKATSVVARIVSDGISFSVERKIIIGYVDLLWQADSTVHPFFKGKALPGFQTDIKVFAIPNLFDTGGQKITDDKIDFRWRINGTVNNSVSGYGKNSISIPGTISNNQLNISVDLNHPASGAQARNAVQIQKISPLLVLYENAPLYGIMYNKAIKGEVTGQKEMKLNVIPYFFSPSNIQYEWRVNGDVVFDRSFNTATFGNQSDTETMSNIFVQGRSLLKGLQSAGTSVNLKLLP